jgi:hypothetical protein
MKRTIVIIVYVFFAIYCVYQTLHCFHLPEEMIAEILYTIYLIAYSFWFWLKYEKIYREIRNLMNYRIGGQGCSF